MLSAQNTIYSLDNYSFIYTIQIKVFDRNISTKVLSYCMETWKQVKINTKVYSPVSSATQVVLATQK